MFLIAWLLIFGFIGYGIYTLAKKSIVYVASPLNPETDDREDEDTDVDENDGVLKVAIKSNNLDTSRIVEYEGEELQKFEFRPQTWKQFIGQEEAKERAQTIIKKANRGIRSHFILSAIRGHGKTTYVELLAQAMGARLVQRVGKQVDEDSLVDIINEINTSEEKHVMLFIDEIDSMDSKVIKIMNIIVEQFKINEKKIKPFIFACATISKDVLIKNNPDFLDRLQHQIQFTRYTADEIKEIITQYKNQLYADDVVPADVLHIISNSCKFNPRTAIALLEDFIVEKDIVKVLKNCRIVKDGLNQIDIDILKTLSESQRAIGANSLAMRVGLSQSQYIKEYEPFLVEFNYIARVPSRILTDKGKKFLEGLK